MNRRIRIREMTTISLCTALLCISSYIVFPLPFTPIMVTAQTAVVNLIGLILNPVSSIISIGVFILLGAIGLPIFAGGNSGLGVLAGPTGGFIIGFLFSAMAISFFKKEIISLHRYLLITILMGMPITYLFGTTHMSYVLNMEIVKTLQVAVIPFLLGDILKAVLASVIAVRLNRFLNKKYTSSI